MDSKVGRILVVVLACVSLALFGTAIAQQKKDSSSVGSSSQAQGQQPKKNAPVAGRMKLGTTLIETEAVAKGYRASKLVGAVVKNESGERIGKIEDMIVSPDGKVTMAVIEVGGLARAGRRAARAPAKPRSSSFRNSATHARSATST